VSHSLLLLHPLVLKNFYTNSPYLSIDWSAMADSILTSNVKNDPKLNNDHENVVEKLEASVLESPKCKRDFYSSLSDSDSLCADGETVSKKASYG